MASCDFLQRAKNSLRLIDYLTNVLGDPVKVGTQLRWNACPQCGRSKGDSRKLRLGRKDNFFCAKCGAKGDVLQAVQYVEDKRDAVEAARWILYGGGVGTLVTKYETGLECFPGQEENVATTECLKKLFEITTPIVDSQVVNYLAKTRAIDGHVIERAVQEGILRTLPSNPTEAIRFLVNGIGEDLLRESGLWRQGAKAPGIAFRPLVLFFPDKKGAEFRMIREQRPGEVKVIRYGITTAPWVLKGSNSDVWSLTEGAIDMMSVPCLTPTYRGNIMGIPGCNNWKADWFKDLKGKRVYICFDNDMDDPDNPGQTWAQFLFEELTVVGAHPEIRVPSEAKDLNKMLVDRRAKAGLSDSTGTSIK